MRSKSDRWALLEWFLIPDSDDPTKTYLKRLRVIQTPWASVYLHWIFIEDNDRDPHDHPFPFVSAILRGGYVEEVFSMIGGERKTDSDKFGWMVNRSRFSVHYHPLTLAHQIRVVRPGTVTLVLVGRRARKWGFWTPEKFVPWEEYLEGKK